MASRILIIEDQPDIRKTIDYNLSRESFEVFQAASIAEGEQAIQQHKPDLVILDLMLPDGSGLTLCRDIKSDPATKNTLVILLTAKADELDRVIGFELGADDYVTKPFSVRELILRVKAILKRRASEERQPADPSYTFGALTLNLEAHQVFINDLEVGFTALEFRLLKHLIDRKGRVQSRDQLLEEVWGYSAEVTTRTVDTHIKRLREKLDSAGEYIQTIRGVGYRFSKTPDQSFMGIRSRIFFIILSCLFIGISLAFVVAERDLSEGLQEQIENELSKQAKILRQSFSHHPLNFSPNTLKSEIDNYSQSLGARITIIAINGEVLVDSELDNQDLKVLDNHANRPEVAAAITNGVGSSKRFSNTTQQEMLYFALLDRSSEEGKIIRISVPNEYLEKSIASLDNSVTLIVVVALIVAILASFISGNYIRESLMDLERAASAISHGSYEKKGLKSLPLKRSDEIGSMARNISTISSNLKHQISLIAKQRDQFGLVLDGLGDGIMVLDKSGKINFRNYQIMQILGLKEIINKSIHDIELPVLSNMFKQALKKGQSNSEFELETLNDDTRWILASMNKTKGTQELILVVHETTQLRRMDSMRRDFISNLSHELRTPVSVIKANSETLLDGALENQKDARIFSKAILHNADRLSTMVTSLIDLSRIEYGELKFINKNIVLNQIIESIVLSYQNKAKKKNINLVFEGQSELVVNSDASAIERVINNLLDNAFKYSPSNSTIKIKLKTQGKLARISVIDQGEGITEADQELVFKRFFRTASARANMQKGSGLGLAIVKNLVNNLHGEVGVVSTKESGSEFWFTIPIK